MQRLDHGEWAVGKSGYTEGNRLINRRVHPRFLVLGMRRLQDAEEPAPTRVWRRRSLPAGKGPTSGLNLLLTPDKYHVFTPFDPRAFAAALP